MTYSDSRLMTARVVRATVLLTATLAWLPGVAHAQADSPSTTTPTASTGAASVLARTVELKLEGVRLQDALTVLAERAGIQLVYGPLQVPVDRIVSIQAAAITVRDALTVLLSGTGVTVHITPSGRVVLRPGENSGERVAAAQLAQPSGTGQVTGRVTDGTTGESLDNVTVSVVGSAPRTVTALDGRYALRKVPTGAQVLVYTRLGYVARRHGADVVVDSAVHVDVALARSPQVLDEVVSTATGDQQLRSLGTSITTIPADSVTARQPIQQLSDVLNARAAGVQVFNDGGLTGQAPQINIRGQNSASLSNQPIMYVDGIRIDNGYGQDQKTGRYNDILPSEIESIQVVRGPSAATLYGTDAATGIILITTKKGIAGAPRWELTAENGLLTMNRDRFPESYFPWGHATGGGPEGQCTVVQVGAAQCVIDSVTHYTPLRDPLQTPIGTGHRQNYVAQVTGGSAAIRYFTSATTEFETGYLKLPQAERAQVQALPGGLEAVANPNALQKVGLRQSINATLSDRADISIGAGFIDNRNRIPAAGSIELGQLGPGYRDSNDGWAFGGTPASMFENRVKDHAQHVTLSGTADWHPTTAITAHVTVGIDHSNDAYEALVYAGQGPNGVSSQGSANDNSYTQDIYTVDAGLTTTTPLGSHLMATTAIGSEYTRQAAANIGVLGAPLVPSCGLVGCATVTGGGAGISEGAILGGYGEERLGLNDRLFIAGGMRVDGSNTFGSSYKAAVYPKASASWVASSEPFWPRQSIVTSLRLRAGYGESGTQPSAQQALTTYQYQQTFVDGQPVLAAYPTQSGNPNLRPERQREYEGGVDADLLLGRIHTEFTYYDKLSADALVSISLGSSLGAPFVTENVGSVRNQGIEGALGVNAIESRITHVDLGLIASLNRNVLVSRGPGVQAQFNSFGQGSLVPGYPLFGIFDHRYHYQDLNHDGILEPNELTIDTAQSYLGSSYPRSQLTFTAAATVLNGHIRVNAQLDHRDGFVLANDDEFGRCFQGYCQASTDVHSPLRNQAAALAWSNAFVITGYENNGSFTRLREVAATVALPHRLASAIHARSADITLAGRNLALWTKFGGVDPELAASSSLQTQANGAYAGSGIPVAAYWIARLHLGL